MAKIDFAKVPPEKQSAQREYVVNCFKKVFYPPKYKVVTQEGNWGARYSLGIINNENKKRHAIVIEGLRTIGGTEGWYHEDEYEDNSPMVWTIGPPYKKEKIGILSSSDIDKATKEAIEKFKKILDYES